jgi:hypothetical protein
MQGDSEVAIECGPTSVTTNAPSTKKGEKVKRMAIGHKSKKKS